MRRSIAFLLGFLSGWPFWFAVVGRRRPTDADGPPRPLDAEPDLQVTVKPEIQEPARAVTNRALNAEVVKINHDSAMEDLINAIGALLPGVRFPLGWFLPAAALIGALGVLLQLAIASPEDKAILFSGFPLVLTALGSTVVLLALALRSQERSIGRALDAALTAGKDFRDRQWREREVGLYTDTMKATATRITRRKKWLPRWSHWAGSMEATGASLVLTGSVFAISAWQNQPPSTNALLETSNTVLTFAVNLYSGILVNL